MISPKSLSLHPHFQIIGMILCIETSTSNCSVALCDRQGVIALRENKGSKSHATELTVFIEDILKETGIEAKQLEAIAVSKGPGSYTGLRIGVSAAKGIALTRLYLCSMVSRQTSTKNTALMRMTSSVPLSMRDVWKCTLPCMMRRAL